VGGLFIGGSGLARGYLNRPELTADTFIPDPYGSRPGSRMYRTGDLGRYAVDGRIEFLGRSDHQVKLRGFRLEVSDIEKVLTEHKGVQDAVVVFQDEHAGHERLVAYVVPAAHTALPVRQALKLEKAGLAEGKELTRLPNGMIVRHHRKNE